MEVSIELTSVGLLSLLFSDGIIAMLVYGNLSLLSASFNWFSSGLSTVISFDSPTIYDWGICWYCYLSIASLYAVESYV
jgi:hypothetical protein